MVNRRSLIQAALLSAALLEGERAFAMATTAPPHEKSADVDPVTWGKVKGGVYDPLSRKPIPGATVSIRSNGIFETEGRTVSRTDDAGHFECEAELGRKEKKTDGLRLLGGLVAGAALPGTFAETNRTDVDQLTVRVTAPGYQPFEGIVRCAHIHPNHFDVHLSSILLMPENNPAASVCGIDWYPARVTEFRLEPGIALPGETVQVVLRLRCPPPGKNLKGKDHVFKAQIDLPDNKWADLKERTDNGDGTYTFKGSFKAPKLPKNVTSDLWTCTPYLEIPYEFRGLGDALLQIVSSDAGRGSAQDREKAWQLLHSGDTLAAAESFTTLARSGFGTPWDDTMAGNQWIRLDKPEPALERYRSAYQRDKSTYTATRLLQTLLTLEKPEEAVREGATMLADLRSRHKDADLPKYLLGDFMATLGRAYLRTKQLPEARALLDLYQARWPSVDREDAFAREVRLAEADLRLKTMPRDAKALLERAEILGRQEKWPDALKAIDAALAVSPNAPELVRDRVFVQLHLPDAAVSAAEIDAALAAADALMMRPEGEKPGPTSFAPWHILGVLRMARAGVIRRSGGDLSDAYDLAHVAFDGALRYAQIALPRRPRNATWSLVAIQGFRLGAAYGDFDLRQALLILRDSPRDVLALTEAAIALADLGLSAMADAAAAEAIRLLPNANDAHFLRAVIALRQGRQEDAEAGLRALVERVPYHPAAALLLASLVAEKRPGEARRLRAEHAERYGAAVAPVPQASRTRTMPPWRSAS